MARHPLPRRRPHAPCRSITALALTIAVRASAAPFAVNTMADGHDATPGDGICETASGNGICTLRAAIEETSALGGTRTVDVPAGTYMLSVTGACDGVALCVTGTPTITLNGAGADTTIVDAKAASNPPMGSAVSSRSAVVPR
jgi:CSLREA domain-containing protein